MIELNQSWAAPYDMHAVCEPKASLDKLAAMVDSATERCKAHANILRDFEDRVATLEAKYETLATATLDPSDVEETPDPNADLYATIPWAKDAGLELVQLRDETWLYATKTHYCGTFGIHRDEWHEQPQGIPVREYSCGHPTREAALKSPPPMPPGFTPNTTTDYPADVLAACPQAMEWGVVLWKNQVSTFHEWRTADGKHYWNAVNQWQEQWMPLGGTQPSRKDALANPPTIPPPGYVAAKPAHVDTSYDGGDSRSGPGVPKPSLLDELAEVAHDEWFNAMGEDATAWKGVALAVARRLLVREASEAEVSAVIKCKQDREVFRSVHADTREEIKASHRAQLAELEAK